MFGIGMPELIIILVIIVVIFRAGKLPDRELPGKAIKGFKTAVDSSEKEHDDNSYGEKIDNSKSESSDNCCSCH